MKRHANIPIFIPHLGCPNQCVFCNQRRITGVSEFSSDSVRSEIDAALSAIDDGCDAEIAFFGGSFTGIEPELMENLLKIANSYIKSGRISSIRCSTRPDYISKNILDILRAYGVRTIELGLQSLDEKVLTLTKRGHTSTDARAACKMIKDAGFDLVGQMMIGLPGSTLDSELDTARFIAESGACAARIYPTVVFKETELYDMTCTGAYTPIAEREAVERSARVFSLFRECGVEVIRIGLCSSDNLSSEESYYAGPNHPALGELVLGEYYYLEIKKKLSAVSKERADVTVKVANGELSKAIGHKKINKQRLFEDFPSYRIRFCESKELCVYDVSVDFEERKD
ncbi:MAG: radical SAM protein [Clostridia bacterium]|nr:radical SAM protein [Clostridia bacterium]